MIKKKRPDMKKNRLLILLISLVCCLVFVFSACGKNPDNTDKTDGSGDNTQQSGNNSDSSSTDQDNENPEGGKDDENPEGGNDDENPEGGNDDENPEGGNDDGNEETDPVVTLIYERNPAGTGYIVTGDSGQSTAIVIPSEYEGLPVVEIGESAFAYSKHTSDIVSVTIPDSVKVIGKNAFYSRQSDLTAVNIGKNSGLTTIGNNAFSGCRTLTAIYLPAGVTSIGDSAFNNCGSLNTITVAGGNTVYSSEGNNLIEIATHTLIRGSNSSVVPSTVTKIAQAAFRRATLTALTIPVSVTSIGNYIIQDSVITSITYEGTTTQWEAVTKARYWNMGKTDIEVTCSKSESEEITEMYITINGNKLEVTLAKNSSVDALVELLRQGDITYTADDYGNFEKVGNIGHTLPRNDTQINTKAGDVILYQGNNICLYYGNNSWSFTRIGKIEGYSASELRTLLGAGNGSVQVTISLK